MNITSLLSNSYLRPSSSYPTPPADGVEAVSDVQPVQRVPRVAEERVGGSFGRYTAAEGDVYVANTGTVALNKKDEIEESGESEKTGETDFPSKSDLADSNIVRELKLTEREVRAHESAHMAAGGRFVGAVSYTYTEGPDGKLYISGGEVPISVPVSDNPEQTVRNMEQVRAAAMAPANPSAQDLSVAAQAAAQAARARQEISRQTRVSVNSDRADSPKTGASSLLTELQRDRLLSEEDNAAPPSSPMNTSATENAYAQTSSERGLWTISLGFEPGTSRILESVLPRPVLQFQF